MPTTIASQSLAQSIAGAGDNDIVRVTDGKVTTARQSFFGRILRLLPSSARDTRERQAEAATVTHSLLIELKSKFDAGDDIANAAMRMAGLGTTEDTQAGRNTPITVRQIREAHACAKLLSDQARRSAATLAAISYAPLAPGFDKFAREQAGVDPEQLTEAQRTHYQYMLQRHIAVEPQTYVANGAQLRKFALQALKYVAGMTSEQIETAQNDTLAQRNAAATVLGDLTANAGAASLAASLDGLHDAAHLRMADAMLGNTEYGAFMTIDTLALEHAVGRLSPQQARAAYFKAMANEGAGRAVLAALGEKADELGKQSRQATDPDTELQLELAAKRALELQATARIVLQTLGERGGVENIDRQLGALGRPGAERKKAAGGALAAVDGRLNAAVAKELSAAQLRAAAQ